jgi:hypothetical protein
LFVRAAGTCEVRKTNLRIKTVDICYFCWYFMSMGGSRVGVVVLAISETHSVEFWSVEHALGAACLVPYINKENLPFHRLAASTENTEVEKREKEESCKRRMESSDASLLPEARDSGPFLTDFISARHSR